VDERRFASYCLGPVHDQKTSFHPLIGKLDVDLMVELSARDGHSNSARHRSSIGRLLGPDRYAYLH
jgi:hypothetical protein